jgi:hypothetical protein
LKGNRLFKKSKFSDATDVYLMALNGLKYDETELKNERMKNELSIPLLLNIAQALIKLDKFGNAIIICNKVMIIYFYLTGT